VPFLGLYGIISGINGAIFAKCIFLFFEIPFLAKMDLKLKDLPYLANTKQGSASAFAHKLLCPVYYAASLLMICHP